MSYTSSPGTPDLNTFFTLTCEALGGPASPYTIGFFEEWAQGENTNARNNPLADEQDRLHTPGAVQDTPGTKAWSYPDMQSGAANTAAELSAIAPTIVAAVRADNLQTQVDSAALADIALEIQTWGTNDFANTLLETYAQAHPLEQAGQGVNTLAGAIVGALGQAILAVLKKIGDGFNALLHASATGIGHWAKGEIIALAVAGIVLYVLTQ